ncbi:MAG: ABC transporter permease [Micromonosporaceae bacterium]
MTSADTERSLGAEPQPPDDPPGASGASGRKARAGGARRRSSRRLWIAATPVAFFALAAVLGPLLYPYDSGTAVGDRLLPPGSRTSDGNLVLLGTDGVGRDLVGQLLEGAQVSLVIGLSAVLLGAVVGGALGLLAGYFGRGVDQVIMRVADVQLAFPSILLAILITGVLGPSLLNLVIALSLTRWVVFARVGRASALGTKSREYVDVVRALGASHLHVLWRYILPNAVTPVIVLATVEVGLVILAEASLSFLGLGTPPSQPSWGLTIAEGREYLATGWWICAVPGAALALLVVSIGVCGDELRNRFDPNLQTTL